MLQECSNLKWIYIPNSMVNIDKAVFDSVGNVLIKCDAVSTAAIFAKENGFEYETVYYWDYELNDEDKTAILKQYTGNQEYVTVPSEINGYRVTTLISIRNSAIKTLYIPSSVEYIEDMFAYFVETLENVMFDNAFSIKHIGSKSFKGTKYEALMNDKNGMLIIGDILASFTGEGNIIIPNGIKTISSMAFAESDVDSIELPDSVEKIGDWAFRECKKLKSVYIKDRVTDIGEHILDGSDGANIICHQNTVAEKYAKKNGYGL